MDVQAFAVGWAAAYSCKDDCIVEAEAATEAVGNILATAAAEAYAGVCGGGLLCTLLAAQQSRTTSTTYLCFQSFGQQKEFSNTSAMHRYMVRMSDKINIRCLTREVLACRRCG
jgi:hypothetical protein